jgi:hypothetical protein
MHWSKGKRQLLGAVHGRRRRRCQCLTSDVGKRPHCVAVRNLILCGCRKLKALQSLEVCGGGVTDSGVACLQDLSQLRSLSLAQVIMLSGGGSHA